MTGTSRSPIHALTAILAAVVIAGFALPLRAGTAEDASSKAQARTLTRQAEDLISSGKYAQAEPVLERACALSPTFLRPIGLKGLICQIEGNKDGAIQNYTTMQCALLDGPPDQCKMVARMCAEDLFLVNQSRADHNRAMLRPHPMLSLQATEHSEEMRDLGYFAHESPVASHATPMQRFEQLFKFRPFIIGENIAMRRGGGGEFALTLANIRKTHQELMNSPGHRANILGDKFTDYGVGLAANNRGDYWLTEEFVRFAP